MMEPTKKMTLQEVLALQATMDAKRRKEAELDEHLVDIVAMVNRRVSWSLMLVYLHSLNAGTYDAEGNIVLVTETQLRDFVSREVPKYDVKHGTTEEVKLGRRPGALNGKGKNARREVALRNGTLVSKRSQKAVMAPQVGFKPEVGAKQAVETKEAPGAVKVAPRNNETFKGLNAKKGIVVSTTPEDTNKALAEAEAVANEFAVKESEKTKKSPLGRIQMEQEAKLNRNNE